MSDFSSLRSRERGRPSRLPGETPGVPSRRTTRSLSRAFSSSPSRRVRETGSPLRLPLQQRAPPVGPQLQGQGTTFLGTGQPQQQPASVTEQQLASQVVQAQSQQISELVQLVKSLGEMQAASLARGAVSASAGASGTATGAETVGDRWKLTGTLVVCVTTRPKTTYPRSPC